MKILRPHRTGQIGRGCVLYYADHLKTLQRKNLYSPEVEALWLHVRFPATSVLFEVIHRRPDDNNFFNIINIILEIAWLKSSNIFLLSDLNCDYSDCRNTNRAKLQCIFDSVNMHNVITNPTRNTVESSTLIDLVVTTRLDLVSTTEVFPLGISDHDLIYATIRLKNIRLPARVIKVRDSKKMYLERFKSDIEYATFQVAFTFDDTDDVLWAWQSLFDDICNTHVPWKEVKLRVKHHHG